MKRFFLFLCLLVSSNAMAVGFYFGPGFGYGRFLNDQLKGFDAVSSGPRLGATVGYNFGQIALESFYNSMNTKTNETRYNDQRYVFHAKINSFGAIAKYFIEIFHIRAGFAYHTFNLSVTSYPDGAMIQDQAVLDAFGANGKHTYYGPLFGFGIDLPVGAITPYVVATSYQLNGTTADIMELELGIKISL